MAQKYFPGATVGIIGSSQASALLAQVAGRLGYRVASLVTHENNPVRQFASWQTVTPSYNDQALRYFGGRVDVVYSEPGLLTNRAFQVLGSVTGLTLSEDLMALTTDRLLEKAFLDRQKALVAPFSLVTSLVDVQEAVEYIGFPCVLKASQRHIDQAEDHVVLYSEEDYDQAQAKLDLGSCVLEAWIPYVSKLSVIVVRNERGEILIYPAFERADPGEAQLGRVQFPADAPQAVKAEIYRLAQKIAENLKLIGSLTIKCFVTSAHVLYINEVTIGLGQEAFFTLGALSMSHFEATARAIVGLPLPDLAMKAKAAISLPIEALDRDKVMTQFMLRTDWGFALFNPIGNDLDYLTGQVVVTGDSLASCYRQIELTEILTDS